MMTCNGHMLSSFGYLTRRNSNLTSMFSTLTATYSTHPLALLDAHTNGGEAFIQSISHRRAAVDKDFLSLRRIYGTTSPMLNGATLYTEGNSIDQFCQLYQASTITIRSIGSSFLAIFNLSLAYMPLHTHTTRTLIPRVPC